MNNILSILENGINEAPAISSSVSTRATIPVLSRFARSLADVPLINVLT